MARPKADLTVARTVDGVDIYTDLAGLPDVEAVKKSKIRSNNQNRPAKPRTPRAAKTHGIPTAREVKARATAEPAEAKPIRERQAAEIKNHDAALVEFTKKHKAERADLDKRHASELVEVQDLIRAIQLLDGVSGESDLSAPARKRLAEYK